MLINVHNEDLMKRMEVHQRNEIASALIFHQLISEMHYYLSNIEVLNPSFLMSSSQIFNVNKNKKSELFIDYSYKNFVVKCKENEIFLSLIFINFSIETLVIIDIKNVCTLFIF